MSYSLDSLSPSYIAPRRRWVQLAALIAVVALGLASRAYPAMLPAALGKYPGDALWALMIFVGLGGLWPRAATAALGAAALLICYGVEFSQLYQAPWIVELRSHTLGHLVLGSHFGWIDLIAYAIGVGAGMLLDKLPHRHSRRLFRP